MGFLRRENATAHARAALAVSHDFDGLLRLAPCRFVAPCCRSWGSPRFRFARSGCPGFALPRDPDALCWLTFPVAPYPSKLSPRHQLCAASPQPLPSRRYRRFQLSARWCRHHRAECSHASARPQGLVPVPSPLLRPGVATWKRLDAPLGLFPSKRLFSSQRLAGTCERFRLQVLPCAGLPRECCAREDRAGGWFRLLVCTTSEEVRARRGASTGLALLRTGEVVPSSRGGLRPGASRGCCLSTSRWALFLSTEVD
jgi:hypothetical protein